MKLMEIPKNIVTPIAATSTDGRLGNLLAAGRAGELVQWGEGQVQRKAKP